MWFFSAASRCRAAVNGTGVPPGLAVGVAHNALSVAVNVAGVTGTFTFGHP
jgi:hypothetical protein